MGASFNQKYDKDWLLLVQSEGFDETDEALIETNWDFQTEEDVAALKQVKGYESLARKVCLTKLVTFPIEYGMSVLLFGFKKSKNLLSLHKLYYKFVTKKYTLKQFQKELDQLTKGGRVL